ncbi:hypothetical protein Q766_13655 [Flavobacterium subsaxonicum WB 4.1-42 = DSM 21790]|uniref:Uncharacterized protein n=1 Tax=Flavobacterium subsaxonicum WB 4.1-42 = DSM 21790 TaxID=1121898 RepID=A0A0A2ML80_9FLAO|nr:hypothetical protein Q766_13655 [Flavobacterium subsaxonicum WB 4.1-42 = DSM 21790]
MLHVLLLPMGPLVVVYRTPVLVLKSELKAVVCAWAEGQEANKMSIRSATLDAKLRNVVIISFF